MLLLLTAVFEHLLVSSRQEVQRAADSGLEFTTTLLQAAIARGIPAAGRRKEDVDSDALSLTFSVRDALIRHGFLDRAAPGDS